MTEKKAKKQVRETVKKAVAKVDKKRIDRKKASAKKAEGNRVSTNRLKLLITVVGRNKAEYYADLLESFEVNMQMLAMGSGTADAKMLGLLGLDNKDKVVIFSIIQEKKISDALYVLERKFQTIKDGKGVAFTVPLDSMIGALQYSFLSNVRVGNGQ